MKTNFSATFTKLTLNVSMLFLFLTISGNIFAQRDLFTALNISESNLDSIQDTIYKKIINQSIYLSINFVSTANLSSAAGSGKVRFSLPYLPITDLTLTVDQVEYTNDSNFTWYGKYFSPNDTTKDSTIVGFGTISILAVNGKLIGHIQLDNHSFELYDLTGGIQVLCETDMMLFSSLGCATDTVHLHVDYMTQKEGCENIKTKVLVFYTPAADNYEPDITGKANLAISQINQIWENSLVGCRISLAAVIPYNFSETNNIGNDLDYFSNDVIVQNLRSKYLAEIVVLLTQNDYPGSDGRARNIGGNFEDAYCILNCNAATNDKYVFAHEVNHLYGARHDNDPDPGFAHGYVFKTGDWHGLFGTQRWTLMAISNWRIMHVSNPIVKFIKKPTGTWNRNNVQEVNQLRYNVSAFFTDPYLSLYANVSINNPQPCDYYGTATAKAQCGDPPYSYDWFMSDNGMTWITYGNAQTISIVVPAPSNNGIINSRMFKVKVTDANSNVAWAYGTGHYSCFPGPGGDHNQNPPRLSNKSNENSCAIFPNPTTGQFTIKLVSPENDKISITINNLIKQHVDNIYIGNIYKGEQDILVQTINKMAPGLYFINVIGKFNNYYHPIIIK